MYPHDDYLLYLGPLITKIELLSSDALLKFTVGVSAATCLNVKGSNKINHILTLATEQTEVNDSLFHFLVLVVLFSRTKRQRKRPWAIFSSNLVIN